MIEVNQIRKMNIELDKSLLNQIRKWDSGWGNYGNGQFFVIIDYEKSLSGIWYYIIRYLENNAIEICWSKSDIDFHSHEVGYDRNQSD
jgi:hypothetical protein